MYAEVRLLKGYKNSLTYIIPEKLKDFVKEKTIVKVPIQNRVDLAIVLKILNSFDNKNNFKLKEIINVEPLPKDDNYQYFCSELADYYCIENHFPLERIKQFLSQKDDISAREIYNVNTNISDVTLNNDQQYIVDEISKKISAQKFSASVIHGVTGSGKTEVYKRLIEGNFNQNNSTIILLPEVSLASKFETIFKATLPNQIPIFGFHSGCTTKEKKSLWSALLANEKVVIIGVHLPILLPVNRLGLILIDEEHESGYQEKKHPKINSKEAAIMRAKKYNIPIVLGSATPSISTVYNISSKGYQLFELKKRFSGNFAKIEVIKLNKKEKRDSFWISKELQENIHACLEKKEQAIIFLNRRGYCFFVQCKECSFVFNCKNCSVSLTLHANDKLICHYCATEKILSNICPECKKANSFLKKGLGTQQMVEILKKIFPKSKVARADLDASSNKKLWKQTLLDFENQKIDILVGTQTITKGYHFPKVTLVGIIWADSNLNFPIYNACETTLQQLIQVAGRAGRQSDASKVIIQTFIEHAIYKYLNEIDYMQFYAQEIEKRQVLGYPPCNRIAEIEIKFTDENTVKQESSSIFNNLENDIEKYKLDVIALGPAMPLVGKINNIYTMKILLKSKSIGQLKFLYKQILIGHYKSKIYFTPNPIT